MHLMVIGITMEMNLVVFLKACSTLSFEFLFQLIWYIFVELEIGKNVTSNDPNEKDLFDEVGLVTEKSGF